MPRQGWSLTLTLTLTLTPTLTLTLTLTLILTLTLVKDGEQYEGFCVGEAEVVGVRVSVLGLGLGILRGTNLGRR